MKRMLALLLLLLAGCGGSDSPEIVAKNEATLSGKGQHIGTLPDGRDVTRYEIERTGENHFIYVVAGSVSTNHEVKTDDTSRVYTEVVIDGIVYRPATNRKAEKE